MANFSLLEDRVIELENQIFGLASRPNINDPLPETSIVDNLLHVNTLTSSALSGRDKANNVIKRLPELNGYLDPGFQETDLQCEAKLELILAMENDIRENLKLFQQIEDLKPALDTENIKDLPDLSKKLNNLTLTYLKAHEDAESLTSNVHELFARYNDVITSISKSLISLDNIVTAAEAAAAPSKQVD